MPINQLITWIVVGGISGWLAKSIVGGIRLGLAGTVLVGIVGAFIGGWLFQQFNISIGLGNPLLTDIVTAFVGAVVLLLILRAVR
jgi:uncharacterized membrane protein YeaQ/YmgE (transglycosylase-associated protein family)